MAKQFFRGPDGEINRLLIAFLVVLGIATAAALGYIINYRITQDQKEQEYIATLKEQETAERAEAAQLAAERAQLEAEDSFYQKLADGFDVRVLVVGDTIGTGAGASSEDKSWPKLLETGLETKYGVKVELANVSMVDNTSYAGYARTMSLAFNDTYDLVILCYGQKDATDDISLYYEGMIRGVKTKLPNASIVCVKESSERNYPKKMENIQALADRYGLPVVDTIAPFQDNYDALVTDEELPNDDGQLVYNQTIMGVIDPLVSERRGHDPDGVEPLNERAVTFDIFDSLPASEFTREGNTFTYSAPVSGVILGIDYTLTPQTNWCEILIDGESYATPEVDYNKAESRRQIMVVNRWLDDQTVKAEREIRVVFSEGNAGKAQADGFNGLMVSGVL